jgi:hypothetical protein
MSQPAPGWLRNLAAARAHYEERFGWPVAVQVSEQQLAIALGQVVDAITMPAELGARVHAQLSIAMLAGPVIEHPDGKRWTFLTQTASTMQEDAVDGLAEHGVRHAATGTYTVIPTEPADAGWRWVAEPRPNQMLPSAYAVVATARRLLVS